MTQPSYGQSAAPPRRSGMTKVGKWMFIIGLILTIIAGAVGAWGAISGVNAATEAQEQSLTLADGAATVSMEADETRVILGEAGASPACTVTDGTGNDVPLDSVDSQIRDSFNQTGEGLTFVDAITAPAAGEYAINCDAGATTVTGPMDIGSLITQFAAAAIAVLLLIPLIIFTIIGLILWLVGRGKDKRAALAGPPGGYGAPGGYDQSGYRNQGTHQPGGYQQGGYPGGPGTSPQDTPPPGQDAAYGQYPPPQAPSYGEQPPGDGSKWSDAHDGDPDDPYAGPDQNRS